jgi:hypothetical protein
MASAGYTGWTNPRPGDWSPEAVQAIVKSLETYLRAPKFNNGIHIGNGTGPVYDDATGTTAPPTVTPFNQDTVDGIVAALPPDDGAAPGTVTGLALTAGINSIFAKWDASTATDVKDGWGTYRVQLDNTSNTFPSPEVDKVVGGTFTSFTGLVTGTTYYVRVAAIDAYGNQSASWSSVVSTAPIQVTGPDIAANTITAGNIFGNTITAAEIATDAITANELAAMNLAVGKYIRSTTYTAGSAGFDINANGSAEFNNITARGVITATTFATSGTGSARVAIDSTSPGTIVLRDTGGVDNCSIAGFSGDLELFSNNDISLSSDNILLTSAVDTFISATGNVDILTGNAGVFRNSVLWDDDAWTSVSFSNSWTDYGSGYQAARYKMTGGQVEVQGLIKSGTLGTAAFTLPTGYRPAGNLQFGTIDGANAAARIDVNTAGQVIPQTGSNTAYPVSFSFTPG